MQLTDTHIKAVKLLEKPKKYFDGGGLFLYVPTTGKKFWRMTYRFDRKEKLLSFGEYPTITLKEAREYREEVKKLLAKGIDPSEHKKAIQAERIIETQNSFKNISLEWYGAKTTTFSETRVCPKVTVAVSGNFQLNQFRLNRTIALAKKGKLRFDGNINKHHQTRHNAKGASHAKF